MSIVGNKDARRMEVVRYLEEGEDMYYSVLNRPVEDVEQRTKDLNKQLRPARAFEVHQTFPASTNVQVAAGWYMQEENTKPRYWPETGDTDIIAIPAAGAATYRCDLISIHPATGVLYRSQGSVEVNWANAWTNRARLPKTTTGRIPLAYVYVDDTGGVIRDTTAINNNGHIRDVRSSFAAGRRVFEDDSSYFLSDVVSGNHGTSFKIARGDHKHPVNAGSAVPQNLSPDNVAADGTTEVYSRNDHVHSVTLETGAANLKEDVNGASVGVANKFVRSDHQHPLNVPIFGVPTPVNGGVLGDQGVSNQYARLDHRHHVEGVSMASELWQINFVNTSPEVTTLIANTNDWLWTWIIYSANTSGPGLSGGPHPGVNYGWNSGGFGIYAPGLARATGMTRTHNSDETNSRFAVDFNSEGSNQIIGGAADHHSNYDIALASGNIDEVPYDTFVYGYQGYGGVWEFSENTTVSSVSIGFNVKMTTWNKAGATIGLTATLPIWGQFNGIMMTQG